MRASVILVLAVLVALLAFDLFEYDGYYRKAALDKIEHQVEDLLHH